MARKNPPAKWVLPEVVDPDDRLCMKIPVPNDRFHIAAFRGALLNLAAAYKWQDDVDHTAKDVALVWRDIIDDLNWGCGLDDVRQNEENPCTLEKTFDGETWEAFADLQKCPPHIRVNNGVIEWFDPTDSTWKPLEGTDERKDGTAPIPYPDNPDGNCLAAENITSVYQSALTQVRAGLIAGEVAVAIAATVTGIMSLFIPAAIVSTFALALTGIALDIGEAGLDDMLDTDSLDHFKCTIYCNIETDGSVTASDFTQIRAAMGAWADSAELAIIQYWLDGFGSVGLQRQGTANNITTGDCDDCDCGWTRVYLNGAGNSGAIVLEPVDQGSFGNGGNYNATEDRFDSPDNASVGYHVVSLKLNTSAASGFTITRVKMFASGTIVNNAGSDNEWKIKIDGTDVAFVAIPQASGSPHTQVVNTGIISHSDPNEILFYVEGSKVALGVAGYLYINRIEISGDGVMPF